MAYLVSRVVQRGTPPVVELYGSGVPDLSAFAVGSRAWRCDAPAGSSGVYVKLPSGVLQLPASGGAGGGVTLPIATSDVTGLDAALAARVLSSDARLSDARTPLAHNQAASTISDSTPAGRAVLTAADAAAQRTALGLGTAATAATTAFEASGAVATHAALTTHLSANERAAIVGTSGTAPSGTNKLVDSADPRLALRLALSADGAAIGTTAAAALGTVALAAGKRYRIVGQLLYTVASGTALAAFRGTYSGTLGAVANGQSQVVFSGTSGNPTVWAALARVNVVAVNGTMPTTTGGIGNTGNVATVAAVDISGAIFTNTAGNFSIAAVASAANGLVPKAGSWLELLEIP